MSIKKNFVYSLCLTLSNYIFPLITYPYVSRVLGVENIGFCAYVDSIINFVMLFSMMGVFYVGLRAIAQNRDDREKRSCTFSNLFIINFILCFVTLLCFNITLFFLDDLERYIDYIIWGEFKIIFNIFLIEWLYRGVEDFKYITIRTIFVKIVYVILVFCLVRTSEDMLAYYLLSIFMVAGNFLVNWYNKKKYVVFSLKKINIKSYIPQVLSMGLYTILTSVYATFNMSMLGYLCNEAEVGYYNTSLKIFHILTGLFTAFSTVLVPRMSAMVMSKDNSEKIQEQISKTFSVIFVTVFPLVYFFFVFADDCVLMMSGIDFLESVSSLRVLLILLIPFSIDQVLILQILIPLKKDKVILLNTSIAAVLALICIFSFVPAFGSTGTAFVLLFSEIIIMVLSLIYIIQKIDIKLPYACFIRSFITSIPYLILFYIVSLIESSFFRLTLGILLGICLFVVERVKTKDIIYAQAMTFIKRK